MNNAGGGATGSALQSTKEDVERTFRVNVFASLYMTQAVVPVMPRGGRIVNIGTIASKMGTAPIPLYSASKAAQDALAYAMAMEVGAVVFRDIRGFLALAFRESKTRTDIGAKQLGRGFGITVNTVAPGPVPTGKFLSPI